MRTSPDVATILACAVGAVPAHKLHDLSAKLERAVGRPLTKTMLDDPNIMRQRFRERLRTEGATSGTIQSYEQLFMGIIRRAAIAGLVDAPPEGPWTTAWQAVLDVVVATPKNTKAKAAVRSLAAWATGHGLGPIDVDVRQLDCWAESMAIHDQVTRNKAELALSLWREHREQEPTSSGQTRRIRLLRKAQSGSVRHAINV